MKLTPGKLAGIKAVSNDRGVIAAAAMDQRGSLKKALGQYATDAGLEEFKINVTEVLTKYASAILLDPEWGLPAAKRRAKGSGLLLAYEKTGYDKTLPGRLPDLLDLWSAKRLKEAGADCVKILLYYSHLRRSEDQRPEAGVDRAHRRRVQGQRHPVLPRTGGLQRRPRREGRRVREVETGSRGQVDGGVLQGPLRRGRVEGRDSGEPAVRRRREVVQRHRRPTPRRKRSTTTAPPPELPASLSSICRPG